MRNGDTHLEKVAEDVIAEMQRADEATEEGPENGRRQLVIEERRSRRFHQ